MTKDNGGNNGGKEELPEIDSAKSAVSSGPKQNKAILILIGGLSLFLIYIFFFANKKPVVDKKKEVKEQKKLAKKNISDVPIVRPPDNTNKVERPTLPKLPETPVLAPPKPLEAPKAAVFTPSQQPNPVEIPRTQPVQLTQPQDAASMQMPQNIATPANLPPINSVNKKNNADARKKSSIMLSGGGGGSGGGSGGGTTSGGAAGGTQTTTKNVSDSDYYFTPALSEAKRNKVTTIGNLAYTIAQGKIIDCVLETAINTDLPGIVRAIISRDVFAEAGKNILIPKGSRLIGSYTANVAQGQSRVSIVWNRLIRPDGIDMSITSNAIDKLGRAGVNGDLDNKYFETLGNAMLLSIINIGAAAATQKITNAQNPTSVTTTNGNNTVTQNSGNATDTAVQNAISTFNSTTNGLVQNALKVTPTVTIDQGTIVKVLINQDVIFPADLAQGVKIIQ